jgi:hypothetical protein
MTEMNPVTDPKMKSAVPAEFAGTEAFADTANLRMWMKKIRDEKIDRLAGTMSREEADEFERLVRECSDAIDP